MKALVIVGAGLGLGMSLAKEFGRKDFNIGLIARRKEKLDDYTRELAALEIEAEAPIELFPYAIRLVAFLVAFPYLWIIGLAGVRLFPWQVLGVLFATPIAIELLYKLRAGAPRADELAAMKWSAWHHWAFGLLFALGLWLG